MIDIAPGDMGVADCYARMAKISSDALDDPERAQDLWRCLHCGLCTQTCPRQANPSELILGLRRYMVAHWRREGHV